MVSNLKWLMHNYRSFSAWKIFQLTSKSVSLSFSMIIFLVSSGSLAPFLFSRSNKSSEEHFSTIQTPKIQLKSKMSLLSSFKFSAKIFKHILALGSSAKTLIRLNHRGRFSRAESTISRKLGNLALRVLCKKNTNTSGFESMPTGKKKVAFKMLTLASFSYALAS